MRRKLSVESLEMKRLLAADMTASYDLETNTLFVAGNSEDNALLVSVDPNGGVALIPLNGSSIEGDMGAPPEANLDIRLYKGNDTLIVDDASFLNDQCPIFECPTLSLDSLLFRGGDGADIVEVLSANVDTMDIATNLGADQVIIGVEPISEEDAPIGAAAIGDVVVEDPVFVVDPLFIEDLKITTGSEDDDVFLYDLTSSGLVEILTGGGDDDVVVDLFLFPELFNLADLEIGTASGMDEVQISSVRANSVTVKTGNDDDFVDVLGNDASAVLVVEMSIETGTGNDDVFASNYSTFSPLTVLTGRGNDEVYIVSLLSSVNANINTGADEDFVSLEANPTSVFNVILGPDDDIVALFANISPTSDLRGSGGFDTVELIAAELPNNVLGFEEIFEE